MPNPAKAPAGYVLVTEGVVQEGDWFLSMRQGRWVKFIEEDFGLGVATFIAILRPPSAPDAVPCERELEDTYISAVKGRSEFLSAYSQERTRVRDLERALNTVLNGWEEAISRAYTDGEQYRRDLAAIKESRTLLNHGGPR